MTDHEHRWKKYQQIRGHIEVFWFECPCGERTQYYEVRKLTTIEDPALQLGLVLFVSGLLLALGAIWLWG